MENDIDQLQRTLAGLIHEVLDLKMKMKWIWPIFIILGLLGLIEAGIDIWHLIYG